jgi:hypothetical protein
MKEVSDPGFDCRTISIFDRERLPVTRLKPLRLSRQRLCESVAPMITAYFAILRLAERSQNRECPEIPVARQLWQK